MVLDRGIWMLYLAFSGLSLFEIGLVESFYHIASFSLEVPTGAIADIFSRKLSRVLGRLSYALSILLMLLASNFWGFILAFFFTALAGALESGAGDALIYDSLKELGDEKTFMKIKGAQEMIFHLTGVITLIAGGILANISYDYVYIVGGIFALFALITSVFFEEPSICQEDEKVSFFTQLKNSVKVMTELPHITMMMIAFEGLAACVTTSFFYMQNYMASWGLTTIIIGVVLATGSIVNGLVSLKSAWMAKYFGLKRLLLLIPAVSALAFILLPLGWIGIGALMILTALESVSYVVISDYVNKNIPSAQRATILSFQSMAFSVFMIAIFPMVGLLGDKFGLSHALWVMGVVSLVITVVMYKLSKVITFK